MSITSQEISAHTPGPWDVLSLTTGAVYGPHGRMVASVYGDHPDCVRDARQDANARLIATAPELLALAKRMLAAWEGSGPGIFLDDIRALIAKAEGRS